MWHVVATRGGVGGDWGFSVAFEEGQLLDFKVRKVRRREVPVNAESGPLVLVVKGARHEIIPTRSGGSR